MRLILAILAAAGVGALGALILGEYNFSGIAVLAAGVLFGLFIAEAAIAVAGHRRPVLGAVCAVIAAAAMVWAAWISTGHDLSFLDPEGWVAVALAAAAAAVRASWTRRAGDNPPREPAPAE